MRAISQDTLGPPTVLAEIKLPRPVPGPTEILVRVHAAGVNVVDTVTRAIGGFAGAPPFVLGWDVSGVVESVGLGVTVFRPGDEVFGMPLFPRAAGAYAEFLTAPARHFAPTPLALNHHEAAALPLAALTAWQALVDTSHVQPGHRVLVHGAAGGVGHLAVQVAKAMGAHVIGTARTTGHEFLAALGIDQVIDYTETDFSKEVTDVDIVIDTVGDDYLGRSMRTMRRGGILVSLSSPFALTSELAAAADALGLRTAFMLVEPDNAGLKKVSALVEAGQLRGKVAAVLPLSQAAEAHRLIESGHRIGKIILDVTV